MICAQHVWITLAFHTCRHCRRRETVPAVRLSGVLPGVRRMNKYTKHRRTLAQSCCDARSRLTECLTEEKKKSSPVYLLVDWQVIAHQLCLRDGLRETCSWRHIESVVFESCQPSPPQLLLLLHHSSSECSSPSQIMHRVSARRCAGT